MNAIPRKHAKLSPSASKRWIGCPGSIRLCESVPPPKETVYAAEGTAAHALAEKCLKTGKAASAFVGELFEGFTASEEMAEAVQVYVDTVTAVPGERVVESRFDVSWIFPGMFGSNDASVFNPETKTLHVFDYKHGVGVIVDPEWNPQLMIYALGALHDLGARRNAADRPVTGLVENVELVIVQPRSRDSQEPVKRWGLPAKDLLFWGLNVLRPAAEATTKKDAPLKVGDHCRFCPAIAVCPEQVKHACAVAKTSFGGGAVNLPSPETLSVIELAKVMDASAIISTWAGEVQAYAQSRMEVGAAIPGYKLVQKRSNRVWRDEATASTVLETVLGEDAYDKKLISPAAAEKAVKKIKGIVDLEALWEKPEAGVTIAPESDKRKAIQPPAASVFIEASDFLQ